MLLRRHSRTPLITAQTGERGDALAVHARIAE
jgi:hypothetical protein